MDAVKDVRPKEWVSREVLALFPIKAVNVLRPRAHGLADGTLIDQVVPIHLHKIPCAATDLLCGGYHMEPLVQ